jgi:hypothetical protein
MLNRPINVPAAVGLARPWRLIVTTPSHRKSGLLPRNFPGALQGARPTAERFAEVVGRPELEDSTPRLKLLWDNLRLPTGDPRRRLALSNFCSPFVADGNLYVTPPTGKGPGKL